MRPWNQFILSGQGPRLTR